LLLLELHSELFVGVPLFLLEDLVVLLLDGLLVGLVVLHKPY